VITISESAKDKIKDILYNEGNPALSLRTFVQGGGCSGFSYGFTLDTETGFDKDILDNIPKEGHRMGDNQTALGIKKGDTSRDLILPNIDNFETKIDQAGQTSAGAMFKNGEWTLDPWFAGGKYYLKKIG